MAAGLADGGDACDPDDDNDGFDDGVDVAPLDHTRCEDIDSDNCDDCAWGADLFDPAANNDQANDGYDTDGDGICNAGTNEKRSSWALSSTS